MNKLKWFCKSCQLEGAVDLPGGLETLKDLEARVRASHSEVDKAPGFACVLLDLDGWDGTFSPSAFLPSVFSATYKPARSQFMVLHVQ